MRSLAYRKISQLPYRQAAIVVQEAVRLMEPSRAPVAPAAGLAGSARNKAFLLLNVPAMLVRVWGKSYQTPAAIVVVKAVSNGIKPCRCRSRRVLILAPELGYLGKGEAGVRGGPAGDLYIFVTVSPHPIFTRDGNNLYTKIPVPMTVAALGDKIEVPTIEGKLHVCQLRLAPSLAGNLECAAKECPHCGVERLVTRLSKCRWKPQPICQKNKKTCCRVLLKREMLVPNQIVLSNG